MKQYWPLLVLLGALWSCTSPAPELKRADPLGSVDPFIGTGGHGHTFPGAAVPFGMVQLSPDTRLEGWDGCSGFHYSDSIVYGFSHTHLSGTGVSDYGDILFMPLTGTPHLQNGFPDAPDAGYASRFDRESQVASPGYYKVRLADYGIDVELTASDRAGMHRYDFGGQGTGSVVIDLRHRDLLLDGGFTLEGDRRVEGFRVSKAWAEEQHVYFSAQFSRQISSALQFDAAGQPVAKGGVVLLLNFEAIEEPLEVQVGISAVDQAGARHNREAEIMGKSFAEVRSLAEEKWLDYLGKIEIAGGTAAQNRAFYTAVYHTAMAPNLFSDTDGRYRGLDREIHLLPPGQRQYTVFSLWDTFRATHPLYTLLDPRRDEAFVRTFLRQYAEGGRLPIWELAGNYTGCMIGYHAIPVITDAYVKGLRDFDTELALEAVVHSADLRWLGLEAYQQRGYIGAGDEPESVSKTLEYAYDDWCIAVLADSLGQDDIADRFYERAGHYRNLYDPKSRFFRARMNGGWQEPFDPAEVNFNFTEANAWQYSTFVLQDLPGLDDLHGGALDQHLDAMFAADQATTGRNQADITGLIGQYAHGNEPSHHTAYLYPLLGRASEGQRRIRQIMDDLYSDQPDGLSGNEDCGQMSAWYVFSAMGFYPVAPGATQYVFGTPLFPEITAHFGASPLRIVASGVDEGKIYVQSVRLRGKVLDRPWIEHAELVAGGELVFEMGREPGNPWPEKAFPVPPLEHGTPAIPAVRAAGQTFSDSMVVRIAGPEPGQSILYRLDTLSFDLDAGLYRGNELVLREDTYLRTVAVAADGQRSRPVSASFFKIDDRRKIELLAAYANQYAAGGDGALIDHLRGGNNFRTGRWQGFREDLEAVVDLGEVRPLGTVRIGFLQDVRSWIWMPKEVSVEVSTDGKDYQLVGRGGLGVPEDTEMEVTKDFVVKSRADARYVRVRAQQYGVCPPWHLGAGGKTWIFADEIVFD